MQLVLDVLSVRREARTAYFHPSTREHIAHKRKSRDQSYETGLPLADIAFRNTVKLTR